MLDNKRILNVLDVVGICAVLIVAVLIQIFWHEEPCPLCLLQRLAWIGMGVSILMNLRFGISSRHYALAMLSALIGGVIALRQISLHVVPGTPAFGSAILGWHLYTWSFFGFVVALFYLALLMFLGDSKLNLKNCR